MFLLDIIGTGFDQQQFAQTAIDIGIQQFHLALRRKPLIANRHGQQVATISKRYWYRISIPEPFHHAGWFISISWINKHRECIISAITSRSRMWDTDKINIVKHFSQMAGNQLPAGNNSWEF